MNPKHSMVFFSVGVILILFLFLIGIPMGMLPASPQQEQTDESDHEMSLKDDGDKEQLTAEETMTIHTESKPIEQMNCAELNQFITSFEKGWGGAIPLYGEKCS